MKQLPLVLATSALLALGAGAVHAQQAQSQQQTQKGQKTQQAQQRQMPPAKDASDAEIASCSKVGNDVLQSLKGGDFAGATDSFTDKFKNQLSTDKLKSGWQGITDKYGQATDIGDADKGKDVQDYTVVLVPMTFEKADMGAQVACTSDGKVANLQIGVMPDNSGKSGDADS